MQAPQTESLLEGKSFPPRVFATFPPQPDQSILCHICAQRKTISWGHTVTTECEHLLRCNECTDYQIEKLYRCTTCCSRLLGVFPPPCSSQCARGNSTLNALCSTCQSTLTKDCTQCKTSLAFRQTREILRNSVHVFVVSPDFLPEKFSRPCSHYAPCKICVDRLCKARKKHAICSDCRVRDTRRAATPEPPEDKCISTLYNVPSSII